MTGPSYGTIDREVAMRWATTPPETDGPIWMVNLMRYHEVAQYAGGGADTVSGREADDRYAPREILADIGAEIVLFGDVDAQLLGTGPAWDRVGVVRYPSRRAFIEMQSRPDFQERHVHKEAGMERTIVMGCVPAPVPFDDHPALALRPDPAALPHPSTPEDGPVVVVHVIQFAPGGREEMVGYQDHAALVAARYGASVDGWFDVEGTILGDRRPWDQVRFNRFPSKAAFMAVVMDPDRLAAQRQHREPAMSDTYTLIVRPTIDALAAAPG